MYTILFINSFSLYLLKYIKLFNIFRWSLKLSCITKLWTPRRTLFSNLSYRKRPQSCPTNAQALIFVRKIKKSYWYEKYEIKELNLSGKDLVNLTFLGLGASFHQFYFYQPYLFFSINFWARRTRRKHVRKGMPKNTSKNLRRSRKMENKSAFRISL